MRIILVSLFLWATSLSAQKIQDTLRLPAIHTVEKGETLFKISQKYSMSISELRELNPGTDILKPGMKLKVKGKWLINPQTTPVYQNRNVILHEILKGETVYGLSKRYNTTIEDLKKINGVQEFHLQPGNFIKVLGDGVTDIEKGNDESKSNNNIQNQEPIRTIDPAKINIDTTNKTFPIKAKEERKGGIIESSSTSKKTKYNLWKDKISVNTLGDDANTKGERASIWIDGIARNQVVAIINPENNVVVYAINQGKPKSKSPKSAEITPYLSEKLGVSNKKTSQVYVQYALPEKP